MDNFQEQNYSLEGRTIKSMKKPTAMDNQKKIESKELVSMLFESLVEHIESSSRWEESYWSLREQNPLFVFNSDRLGRERRRQEGMDMLKALGKGVERHLEEDTGVNQIVSSVKLMLDEAGATKAERKSVELLIKRFEKAHKEKEGRVA